tara:strand:+ start:1804 stop:2547 length:744 start_codon:yes stop_codon:yes gene_type:complete
VKDKLQIIAYEVVEQPMELRTAKRARDWIEELPDRFAYRCLPLALANQVGWEILNPAPFSARWNGKDSLDAIRIKFDGDSNPLIGSHFGSGVLTFSLGYLFRTTKSHNLWVKGPANRPKDGIAPLEGIIETDWAPFTFTMNWQFTRKRHKVRFEKDEPIATAMPYPRHYIRKFEAFRQNINEDPKLYQQYVDWRNDRIAFNEDLKKEGSEAQKQGWQRTYMKGQDQAGNTFKGHETKIQMKEFKRQR